MDTGIICSMTGYGHGESTTEDHQYRVEIRAVNHRYLDVKIRLPQGWLALEEGVKKEIKQIINRGHLDVTIALQGGTAAPQEAVFDWDLVRSIQTQLSRLPSEGEKRLTPAQWLALPGVWSIKENLAHPEEHRTPMVAAVRAALTSLQQSRIQEGRVLQEELEAYQAQLRECMGKMVTRTPKVEKEYRNRIEKRLAEELGDYELDRSRLVTEVALLVERADISEELTRLRSHVDQFAKQMNAGSPVGRRLDFLVQEMNREVNTIGSKANDAELGELVVEAKSILEKMREQVQNIE
ncbi:YicC/YloC family endoribonuclease [Mechercharimyces sp. CAU 1602]|uniref:YicC/YloC family endoribonuclease n=1 Tax=Mechercharimyces sp. CAU 1602 TaxID=2973933 RepID=UPI002161CACE|nr:YicC/YloC family endoribonuclease [Mechercharimyces sp. CAU 1602]MCS1351402.1 YicC family protein [Mechercharimyces sp. CAU 1602]